MVLIFCSAVCIVKGDIFNMQMFCCRRACSWYVTKWVRISTRDIYRIEWTGDR